MSRRAVYGRQPVIGDETQVTVAVAGGATVTLTRGADGCWTGGTLRQPVRHLRDAQRAVRDHATAATLAAEIRAGRDALGLSQAALAIRLGVTANTVARWESGTMAPHPLRVAAIRRALRTSTPN